MDLLTFVAKYGGALDGKDNRRTLLGYTEYSHNLRIGEQVHDGVRWFIQPSGTAYPGRKPSFHRVLVECPTCKKVISAGRLHQHAKVHGITEKMQYARARELRREAEDKALLEAGGDFAKAKVILGYSCWQKLEVEYEQQKAEYERQQRA